MQAKKNNNEVVVTQYLEEIEVQWIKKCEYDNLVTYVIHFDEKVFDYYIGSGVDFYTIFVSSNSIEGMPLEIKIPIDFNPGQSWRSCHSKEGYSIILTVYKFDPTDFEEIGFKVDRV